MKVIDTDVLIDHFHGVQAALNYLTQQVAQGETLALSDVTIAEFSGGMRPGEESKTERLLSLFAVLDVDDPPLAKRAFTCGSFVKAMAWNWETL
jgi:predicted nucleic acid-binding protein